MDIFNFPNHKVRTKYPDNAIRVQFGGAYVFAAQPDSPDQRIFTLKFPTGYKYYVNNDGTIDLTTNATLNNMGALEAFYQAQGTWKTFVYTHSNPMIGQVVVRFNKPLETPEGIDGGDGAVQEFSIELIEVP